MADLERIRRVARLVVAEAAAGHQVAVVVSAMAGRTNELVAWTDGAGAAAPGLEPSDEEYDVVVASGEQVSAGLLAMTLRNLGCNARSWLGWQVPIITDDSHGKARIDDARIDYRVHLHGDAIARHHVLRGNLERFQAKGDAHHTVERGKDEDQARPLGLRQQSPQAEDYTAFVLAQNLDGVQQPDAHHQDEDQHHRT